MRGVISKLPRFWRNVGIVVLGTALAQAIPIMALPYFTRVLSAEVVGIYFLWTSAVAVLASIVSLSLDQAIFTANTRAELLSILQLLIIVACVLCGSAYAVEMILKYFFDSSLLVAPLFSYEFQWAAYTFFFVISQALIGYCIYQSDFIRASFYKVVLAASVSIAQISVVALGFGLQGLISVQVVVYGLITCILMMLHKTWPFSDRIESFNKLYELLKCNYRFVVYSTPSTVLNTVAAQLPFMLIAAKFGAVSVAFYGLAHKILTVPSGFLAGSVLSVFKDEAGSEFRSNGSCLVAYKHAFKSLVLMSFVPFLVLFFCVDYLFIFLFGSEWVMAGNYARLMVPMVFVGFVASPLSYVLILAQKQVWNLIWQISLFIMTFLIFNFSESIETAILQYSVGYSVFYVFYVFMSYRAAKEGVGGGLFGF